MAQFSVEQAANVLAIQQVINEWAAELDINNGVNMAKLVTADCRYHFGPTVRVGRDEIVQHYTDRYARLDAAEEGVPVHRHVQANFIVHFTGADAAAVTFSLIYFSTLGQAKGTEQADPAAVADVRMECRRSADGEWLISMFDSGQSFRRA
jgi:SnoaL-like domain